MKLHQLKHMMSMMYALRASTLYQVYYTYIIYTVSIYCYYMVALQKQMVGIIKIRMRVKLYKKGLQPETNRGERNKENKTQSFF
jgi:hypothetical protein